ncbi:hypothetical protein KEM56_003875, partial [Ascosphaera pollenicola]
WTANIRGTPHHLASDLLDITASHELQLTTPHGLTTWHKGNQTSTLDLAFFSPALYNRLIKHGYHALADSGSDHLPLVSAFDFPESQPVPPVARFRWKDLDPDRVEQEALALQVPVHLGSRQAIDEYANYLQAFTLELAASTVPHTYSNRLLKPDSSSFLDKRRRGLIRFTNALVQHPVLSQEQLVMMFLTVPTELSVWRKQATVSIQEEFTGKMMPPELEDSLPPTLAETFEIVRSGIKRSAEIYINLCNSFDRYARRCEGLGAEQYRIARLMQNLTDCMHDTYAADNKDVPTLNLGISATARHLMASQGLLEDETAAWSEGVLEDLKKQRDCLVAMRDMFDRRDRYARDNIAQLEGRIASNQKKLRDLKGKPEGSVKPTELERIENSIIADKTSIVQQHERGVLIKECVRDEVLYFQVSQYRISRLHQDWSQERVKYAELQASNWRSMAEDVETMP